MLSRDLWREEIDCNIESTCFVFSDRSLKATVDFSIRICKTDVWNKRVAMLELLGKICSSSLMASYNSTFNALLKRVTRLNDQDMTLGGRRGENLIKR